MQFDPDQLFQHLGPCLERALPPILSSFWSLLSQLLLTLLKLWMESRMRRWLSDREAGSKNRITDLVEGATVRNRHQYQPKTL